MKRFIYPDFSKVPKVNEQQALKKQIDARKTEILEKMLIEFCKDITNNTMLGNYDWDYKQYVKIFLKNVGQK